LYFLIIAIDDRFFNSYNDVDTVAQMLYISLRRIGVAYALMIQHVVMHVAIIKNGYFGPVI